MTLRTISEDRAFGTRLVTECAFTKGEEIARLEGYRTVAAPTYQSVQVGPAAHILDIGTLVYLNHSCAPSTHLDTTTMTLRAARDLVPGDELTFFYPSTEWEMAQPFVCRCGAASCLGIIAGAKHLPVATLTRYFVNRHIAEMARDALLAFANGERRDEWGDST